MNFDRNSVNMVGLTDRKKAVNPDGVLNKSPHDKIGGKGKKPAIQGKQTKTSGTFGSQKSGKPKGKGANSKLR